MTETPTDTDATSLTIKPANTAEAMAKARDLAEARKTEATAKADAEVVAKLWELPPDIAEGLERGASNNAPVLPTKNEVIDPETGRPKVGWKFRSGAGNAVVRA